jgi:peptide-methionine (S)-S-oxide reductase
MRARVTGILSAGLLGICLLAAAAAAKDEDQVPLAPLPAGLAEATFASGCFWCSEKDFEAVPGVVEVISGYTGGMTANPTYGEVGTQRSGHYEAVRVRFDPAKVSYDALLEHYWHNVDFLDGEGQFCDRGASYRPAIFVHDDGQRRAAEKSKAALAASGRFDRPVAVPILAAKAFTPAERYHQDYYKKNPLQYRYYRYGCGRDARLQELWPERTSQ